MWLPLLVDVWIILSFNMFKNRFQVPKQLKNVKNKTTLKSINSATWDYIPFCIGIIASWTERNDNSYLTFWTTYYQAKFSTNGSTGDLIVMSCQNSSRSCKITFNEKIIKAIFGYNLFPRSLLSITEVSSVSLLFEFMFLTNHFYATVCMWLFCTHIYVVQQQYTTGVQPAH